jgi:hypothetical protein
VIAVLSGMKDFTVESTAGDSLVEMHHKPCRQYLGIVNTAEDVLSKFLGHSCPLDPGNSNAESGQTG